MAETLSAIVKVGCSATLVGSQDLGAREYALNYAKSITLTNGTGANQANQIWTDTRTLAASATEDLDLAGVLVSPLGTTLTFTRIKAIIVSADPTNTNNVLVGGGTNGIVNVFGAANDIVIVRPGGFFCIAAGDATSYAIAAATADILKVANSSSGSSVMYDVTIIGCV